MRQFLTMIAGIAVATSLPASMKPCRDTAGRIVKCTKPAKTSARCRDANGKFVPCPAPAAVNAPKKSG